MCGNKDFVVKRAKRNVNHDICTVGQCLCWPHNVIGSSTIAHPEHMGLGQVLKEI